MDVPELQYVKSGDVSIAYQVFGHGPVDLVFVRGSTSELASAWEQPLLVKHFEGLASFARVILFDKRGTGLSDRLREAPTLETRMDDVRAVMTAAGSERAVLWSGANEGARLVILFAATYPERTMGLVLYDPSAKGKASPNYPWARSDEEWRSWLKEVGEGWGSTAFFDRYLRETNPTLAADETVRRWFALHMRRSVSPGAAVAFQRMVMEGDVDDVLQTVRVPTLILHRRVASAEAAYVAARIAGATAAEVPDLVDHYSWATPSATEFVLQQTESFVSQLGEPIEPERLLATILFTDIVGSTEWAAKVGDAGWRKRLEEHHELVRRRLAEYRGQELKTIGDGFFAFFDGPGRAIRCACAIRDDVRSLGLEIRAGIHTGEVEPLAHDLGGIAVHIAARVAALADAGEVLVSSTVKDLVAGSGLEFEDRGDHVLRGVPDSWRLFSPLR